MIIDEVQRVPELLSAIQVKVDENRKLIPTKLGKALIEALNNVDEHSVHVDETIAKAATVPLDRMLKFSADLKSGKIVLE